MIVAFINSKMDGLNTFAYSLALAEHYRLTVNFFMVDDQAEDFLNNLEILPDNLRQFIIDAKTQNCLHIFSENQVLKVRHELFKIRNLEAIIFANDYIKKFGHLQLFQEFFELPIPLLLIKHDSVFKPNNDLLKRNDSKKEDDSSSLDSAESTELVKNKKLRGTSSKQSIDSIKSVHGPLNINEEVAANFLIQEFNNQSSNSSNIKKKAKSLISTSADLSRFLAHKTLITN